MFAKQNTLIAFKPDVYCVTILYEYHAYLTWNNQSQSPKSHAECPKMYRKSVPHLLQRTYALKQICGKIYEYIKNISIPKVWFEFKVFFKIDQENTL